MKGRHAISSYEVRRVLNRIVAGSRGNCAWSAVAMSLGVAIIRCPKQEPVYPHNFSRKLLIY